MNPSTKILSSTPRVFGFLCRPLVSVLTLTVLFALSAQAAPTVPFRGVATFSGTRTEVGSGVWILTGGGYGHASQVGKLEVQFVYLVNTNNGTVTGSATATAANGDTFGGNVVGTWTATGITGVVVIDHGTGRFSDATGSADFATSADKVVYEGAITYGRSQRK